MKKIDIKETGENNHYWVISVPTAKREAIVGRLKEHSAVSRSEIHNDKTDVLIVILSARAEDSDRAELRLLIERMASAVEKSERHPILDEKWGFRGRAGWENFVTDKSGILVGYSYGKQVKHLPDLLRALDEYKGGSSATVNARNWARVNTILADMGIC